MAPGVPSLVVEQPLFSPHASGVTAERAVGPDDAVTGNDEAKMVEPVGTSDGAPGTGTAEFGGKGGVAFRGSVRD